MQLEPHFVRYSTGVAPLHHGRRTPSGLMQWGGFATQITERVQSIDEAQGIWFLCPVCFTKNGGAKGTHSCEVTFEGRGAKDDEGSHDSAGKPSRWGFSGRTFEDLTTTPSILLVPPGCGWHGFITNGEVTG